MSDVTERMSEFSRFAHTLAVAQDEDERLQLGVHAAVSLVARCDHAGVTVNEQRALVTRASSDGVVRRANDLQQELREGPCIDVLREQENLVSPDITRERRWPRWAKQVHSELGVFSMMSLLIYVDQQRRSFGALSLYASRGQSFDADDVAIGQALAAHLAANMTAASQIKQLGLALHSRNTIGQAQGILMERLGITADQAFDYLRRASMQANRKVIDIAEEIATSRKLVDLD